jgi:hypothetical protein
MADFRLPRNVKMGNARQAAALLFYVDKSFRREQRKRRISALCGSLAAVLAFWRTRSGRAWPGLRPSEQRPLPARKRDRPHARTHSPKGVPSPIEPASFSSPAAFPHGRLRPARCCSRAENARWRVHKPRHARKWTKNCRRIIVARKRHLLPRYAEPIELRGNPSCAA